MKKLQHKNSCQLTGAQTTAPLPQELPPQLDMRAIQGKILLLEERGKNIQQFYENKLAQLRNVLARQGETRSELTQELRRLTAEGQKQQRYVGQLKERLQQPSEGTVGKFRLKGQESKRSSRGKGCLLFNSKDLGRSPRLALKKCRSEQYIESEYFGEPLGRSEKSIPINNNPEGQ